MNFKKFIVLFFLVYFSTTVLVLDKAFCAVDFSEKIEKYIAKADEALLKNNLVKARKYYSKVLQLDSDNSIAKEGILNINEEIEKQQIYYENRKKHKKEMKEYWIKTLEHFDKGEFVYAKEELNKILTIDPTDVKALQYLEFINEKIDKVNSFQTQSIFKQGLTEFNEGNYEKALSYFNTAYLINPRDDIKDYIDSCNYQINEVKSALLHNVSSSSKGKVISNKQIKKEMKEIYNTGLQQIADKDYKATLKTFSKLKVISDKNKIYDYNKQIDNYMQLSKREISRQFYEEGEKLELEEQLHKAYVKYELASKYDISNKKAKSKLEKLKTVISQIYYEQGLKYFYSGNKEKAIQIMKKALKYEPSKVEVIRFLENVGDIDSDRD